MSDRPERPDRPADPALAAARAVGLRRAALRRPARVTSTTVAVFFLAYLAGSILALVTRDPVATAGLVALFAVPATALAWLPLRDPALRRAWELARDLERREAAWWKVTAQSPVPRSPRHAAGWLDERPADSLARARVLLLAGRPAKAVATLDRLGAAGASPEGDLVRAEAALVDGTEPDLPALRARAGEDVRHAWLLALLEAEAAVDVGSDPVVVLATARADAGTAATPPAVRTLATWALIGAGGIAAAAFVAAAVAATIR